MSGGGLTCSDTGWIISAVDGMPGGGDVAAGGRDGETEGGELE